jgi:uncharacterized membrane protein
MLSEHTSSPDDLPPADYPHGRGMIPDVVPALPRENRYAQHLPKSTAFGWLRAGWADLWTNPVPSLLYGLGISVVSALIVWFLFAFGYEYALFPALAGFMVVGPMIANGLYEKSRRIEKGERAGFWSMVLVKPRSGYQAVFLGVVLLLLFLLWIRAAVLI